MRLRFTCWGFEDSVFWKSLEVYLIFRETQNWKIPDRWIAFWKQEDIPIFYKSLDTLRIITNDFLLFFMNSIHSFIHQILNNCLNNKNIEKGANVINGPLWGGSFFYVVNTHSTKFAILTIFNYAIQWYQLHSSCVAAVTAINHQNIFFIADCTH